MKIVYHAEGMTPEPDRRRFRGERSALSGKFLCGAMLCLVLVGLITVAPRLYAWYAAARAAAAAQDAAERAYYAKHDWERVPQYSVEEVTEFATAFLRKMGYTLHGELGYTHWTTTDAWEGAYKWYHFYAVIDPSWPPLALTCGPWGYYERGPLMCTVTK